MQTSINGINSLEQREGARNKAYKDSKGILTIGVGHTGPDVTEGLVWTNTQILGALRTDVKTAEDAVNQVKGNLNQNMFDALVSFTFNVGAHAFLTSTMKKYLDASDYSSAAAEFDKWHTPPEVTGRRNSEKAQFLTVV